MDADLATTGSGRAFGHHGEVLQGVFFNSGALVNALVTMPCWNLTTYCTFISSRQARLTVFPRGRQKALHAAALALRHIGAPPKIGGHLQLSSSVPVGAGCGSSTCDVLASIYAIADAFGVLLSAQETAKLAVAAEVASDSTMFSDRAVLFAHRQGSVVEYLPGPLPPMAVLSVNPSPSAMVDTLRLPPIKYDTLEVEAFSGLRALLRKGIRDSSAHIVGTVATASARISQRYRPKPLFNELSQIGEAAGAVGIQVAHSGTLIGLMFDAADTRFRDRVHHTVKQIDRELGLDAPLFFNSRAEDDVISHDVPRTTRRHGTAATSSAV